MSIDLFALAWKVNFPGKPIKKLVLLSLADQANDRDHHCWPTYETIAKRCGMSRRTAITTIAELEQDGFIRRVARYKAGGLHTSNAFWVNRATMEGAVAADNGEATSPQPTAVVNVDHYNGDPAAPSMVIHAHPNGDPRSPRTLIDPPSEPQEEPPAATAPTPAAEPVAVAVAAAAPLAAILDWMGFDAILSQDEQRKLDVATLLAWAYTVKLKLAEPRGRVYNPVGLARSLWRHGNQPNAALLRLARGWLILSDEGRARLLGRLDWAADYGADPGAPLDEEFPDIPLATAAQVFAATGGELGPTSLMPPPAPPPDPRQPRPEVTPAVLPASAKGQAQPADAKLWREALGELEMQMTRATFDQNLRGTTATRDGDTLTVHARNPYAAARLAERLNALITKTVTARAGRPITVRYESPAAQPEAQHG